MKLIKQIISDAKKHKTVTSVDANESNTVASLPIIEIDECKSLYIDDKIFEYNMIQRARDAELLLNEILENQDKWQASRISAKVDHLLAKFKIKSHIVKQKELDVPKIQIIDCDENGTLQKVNENDEIEMDYDKLFEQASQARIYLQQLLNTNCECNNQSDESSSEEETMDDKTTTTKCNNEKKAIRLRRSFATKRVNYKGEVYSALEKSLCKHKRRKLALEFPSFGHGKLHYKDFSEGVAGRYTCKEV